MSYDQMLSVGDGESYEQVRSKDSPSLTLTL